MGRLLGGPLGRFIKAKSLLNGNYVSRELHALSDPFRYRFTPKVWKEANAMLSPAVQQWVRIPNLLKGTGAGITYGGLGAAANGY